MKSEWTPLATDFFHHPKVVEVDGSAKLVFLAGLCYAQHHLTDGVVPRRATRHLLAQVEADDDAVDQLVCAGLWTTEADGYRVPNWSEWNQPAESVREKRQRESNRKSQWRAAKKAKKGKTGGVSAPMLDGSTLTYKDGKFIHTAPDPAKATKLRVVGGQVVKVLS